MMICHKRSLNVFGISPSHILRAKLNLDDGTFRIYFTQNQKMVIDCTWSSSDSAYVGTWRYGV